jgi:hypothetical protein
MNGSWNTQVGMTQTLARRRPGEELGPTAWQQQLIQKSLTQHPLSSAPSF